jgi:hypothetical protein
MPSQKAIFSGVIITLIAMVVYKKFVEPRI